MLAVHRGCGISRDQGRVNCCWYLFDLRCWGLTSPHRVFGGPLGFPVGFEVHAVYDRNGKTAMEATDQPVLESDEQLFFCPLLRLLQHPETIKLRYVGEQSIIETLVPGIENGSINVLN